MTSAANRKAKAQAEAKTPLPETKVNETSKDPAGELPAADAQKTAAAGENRTDEQKTPETEVLEEQLKPAGGEKGDRADKAEDTAVSAIVKAEDMLPEFRCPVEGGVVAKGCSLTVPVFSATMNDYRVHRGLDFACAPGTPVLAAADGTVVEVRRDPMMGMTVSIRHSGDSVTTYKGLDMQTADIAHVGDKVSSGQVIGAAGDTALIESAEENHMHFELSIAGKTVDPADYLEVASLGALYED